MLGEFFRHSETTEVGQGTFRCPNCRETTRYRQYEVAETKRVLFFRFSGATLTSFILCERCQRRMSVDDLRQNMPEEAKQLLAALKGKLESGQSLDHALEMLRAAGFSETAARAAVNAVAGILTKKCPACSLRYLSSVGICEKCGHHLACLDR